MDFTFVPPPPLKDPASYANNYEVRICSFALSLVADFEKKVLSGHVDLVVETLVDDTTVLTLDTKTLTIHSIVHQKDTDDTQCEFKLEEEREPFGSQLDITLPRSAHVKGVKTKLRIEYSTSPESSAIQWLPAAQTAGKKYPYLYTQCQAIHARALLPTQDTPSNKCPYTASITVPAPLTALMSAVSLSNTKSLDKKTITYSFQQKVPMASYLVALVIGALEKRDLSDRCAVWSEKEMVDQGKYEFADTEKYLQIGEEICGEYVWGRYDILLLPPAFPYGGMENPCLTFVTPTLLAGDRSLAQVVAHEISHSWMGNLVTSQTWEHFWMNEGFTVFLERKILKALKGDAAMHLHAIIGWKSLKDSVERFGHDHPYTCLNIKCDGVDPDDAFSSVPYEKGFNFLFYLQSLVGEKNMNEYLKKHCEQYRFSCVNAVVWKAFFLDYFKDKAKVLEEVNWDEWLNKPGMPPNPKFDTTLLNAAHQLAIDLVKGKGNLEKPVDITDWTSLQVVSFLIKIEELQTNYYDEEGSTEIGARKEQFASILEAIESKYGFSTSRNSEIRWHWLTVGIRAEMESAMQGAVVFVKEQGRMKFIRPLYRDLFQSVKGKKLAIETFKQNQFNYHSIAQKMVAKDLQL